MSRCGVTFEHPRSAFRAPKANAERWSGAAVTAMVRCASHASLTSSFFVIFFVSPHGPRRGPNRARPLAVRRRLPGRWWRRARRGRRASRARRTTPVAAAGRCPSTLRGEGKPNERACAEEEGGCALSRCAHVATRSKRGGTRGAGCAAAGGVGGGRRLAAMAGSRLGSTV